MGLDDGHQVSMMMLVVVVVRVVVVRVIVVVYRPTPGQIVTGALLGEDLVKTETVSDEH